MEKHENGRIGLGFTIPVLHQGNLFLPDPRAAGTGMGFQHQGRAVPASPPSRVSTTAALAEICAPPDLPSAVVPQPNSVKEIQITWALLIVEVSGFLFRAGCFWQTVELSGQGTSYTWTDGPWIPSAVTTATEGLGWWDKGYWSSCAGEMETERWTQSLAWKNSPPYKTKYPREVRSWSSVSGMKHLPNTTSENRVQIPQENPSDGRSSQICGQIQGVYHHVGLPQKTFIN